MFKSQKVLVYLSFLVISSFACKEIVYIPVDRKPTIVGTWDWIQSTSSFEPGRIATPYTEGHDVVYIFYPDTVAERFIIGFANNDTAYSLRSYRFEKSSRSDSLGTLHIYSEDTRTPSSAWVEFISWNIMKWTSIGPETGYSIWRKR